MLFKGVGTAIITPFNEDFSVDYDSYEKLLDYQMEGGVDALVVCGTTGEASTLTKEEKLKLINLTTEKCGGKIPIIAGTGSNNTQQTIEFSKEVAKIEGVDGLLVVTPYYNKASKEGLYQHFKSIAESVDLPIILYNVPSRTNVNIEPELVYELSKIENIVAIKDAAANIHYTAKVKSLVDDDFAIYSGNDDLIAPLLAVGGHGVISVLSNIMPKETHEMTVSYFNGNLSKAGRDQVKYINLIEALFNEVNPVPIKAALSLMGICKPYLRLPLTEATDDTYKILEKELKNLGKI